MRAMTPGRLRPPLRRLKRRLLLKFEQPTKFGKMDLINIIAKKLKLTNYLEFCTATTGQYYRELNWSRFNTARRLMYNCPVTFNDGLPIDYRSVNFEIEDAIARLLTDRDKIDISLVDPFHTYDCSARDLTSAYDILADGGVLVVHDCLPPNEGLASPTWKVGAWCGETYKAFLDFVLARDDLDYCTVEIDYGCGVIFKNRKIKTKKPFLPRPDPDLVASWFDIGHCNGAAFQFFMRNHAKLLRLIDAKTFVHSICLKVMETATPPFT
jgi:hypothetical protein